MKLRVFVRRIILPIGMLVVLGVAPSATAAGIPTTTVVSSTPNPSIPGMTVTSVAFVFPSFYNPVLPPPTGSVRFEGDVNVINPVLGGTLETYPDFVGVSSLVSGFAQFTSALQVSLPTIVGILEGSPNEKITACYSGDAFYAPSCGSVDQGFVSNDTTLTLMSSANPAYVGQSLQFMALVTARAGIPSGQVRFTDTTTGAFMGSATLDASGRATLPPTLLGYGVHIIQATYVPAFVSLYFSYSGSTSTLREIVFVLPWGE